MGPLKHRWTYITSALKYWPPNFQADFMYEKPCEGCSKCYVAPPPIKWKWWHVFLPPKKRGRIYNTEMTDCIVKIHIFFSVARFFRG